MYSVEEFLEQADQDVDDDLERIVEQDDETGPHEDEAEETPENKDEEGSAKKVPKKVRKPSNRPKLDVERLKGPRGLAIIEKLFTKIEFQGNGHEQDDLQAVMRTLHYWCHRLFPKYSFDDCLEHLERLGSKKPLITLKKKILYDLFEDDQPLVNDVDDVNPDTQEAINEFDLLLQQEPISTLSQRPVTPERIELTDEQKEMIERNRLLAAERRKARLEALQMKQNQDNSTVGGTSSHLTEEQKAIIERNRQQALERRRAKNNVTVASSSQDLNSSVNTVTNSQKSDQSVNFNEFVDSSLSASNNENPGEKSDPSVNFNELVDSFFPESSNENPEKKSDEGVDINDLIEEMNPTDKPTEKNVGMNKEIEMEYEKNVGMNNEIEMEYEVDTNNLLENTNEINKSTAITESNNSELNQNIKFNTVKDKMDVDNLNLETSYDINSTKEDTITNLLEME